MILVGQNDSPFVRRVAVTMRHYGMAYERNPLSVFADYDAVCALHPLGRVPILVLDDGETLADSAAILDHLDQTVGPERALTPAGGPERRHVLGITTLATAGCEKSAALVYEREKRPTDKVWDDWINRLEGQISAVLTRLDGLDPAPWLAGPAMSQADVSAAVLHRFLGYYHPHLAPAGRYPALDALATRCEALPAFQAVPFVEG